MDKKIFWTIIVVIITLTNIILFANIYAARLKDNNKVIKKINVIQQEI